MKDSPWSPEDAVAFREFVAKHRNFIPFFKNGKPKEEGKSIEETALNAKLRSGYDKGEDRLNEMLGDGIRPDPETPFVDTSRDS